MVCMMMYFVDMLALIDRPLYHGDVMNKVHQLVPIMHHVTHSTMQCEKCHNYAADIYSYMYVIVQCTILAVAYA